MKHAASRFFARTRIHDPIASRVRAPLLQQKSMGTSAGPFDSREFFPSRLGWS